MSIVFKIVPLMGKHAIQVKYDHHFYVFRYVYDSSEEAVEAMVNLNDHFGQPAGVQTDLDFNYLPWLRQPGAYTAHRRTTGKAYWLTLKAVPSLVSAQS